MKTPENFVINDLLKNSLLAFIGLLKQKKFYNRSTNSAAFY